MFASFAVTTASVFAATAATSSRGSERQRPPSTHPSGKNIATPTVTSNQPRPRTAEPATAQADAAVTLPGATTRPR